MFKYLNDKIKNNKGFSLPELIVVITLLGVLLTISVPTVKGVGKYNAKRSAIRDMNLVRANLELFRTGQFPYMETPNFVWYAGSFEPEVINGKYTGRGSWTNGKTPKNKLIFARAQKNGDKQHIEWELQKDEQSYGNQFLLYSFGRTDRASNTRISEKKFPVQENATLENAQEYVRMPYNNQYKYCIYLKHIPKDGIMTNGKKAVNDCVEVHCTRDDLEITTKDKNTNEKIKSPLLVYFNSEIGISAVQTP